MKNLKNMDLQEMSKSEMEKFNGGENVEWAIISGVMAGGIVTVGFSMAVTAICPPLGAYVAVTGLVATISPVYYGIARMIASKF